MDFKKNISLKDLPVTIDLSNKKDPSSLPLTSLLLQAVNNYKKKLSGVTMAPNVENLLNFSENYLVHICFHSTDLFSNQLTDARTQFWMKSILEESYQGKTSLIIAGAMHNSGKLGLPNLLASEGYQLTPLMKKAPVPRSVIIRDLLNPHSQSSFFRHGFEETSKDINSARPKSGK